LRDDGKGVEGLRKGSGGRASACLPWVGPSARSRSAGALASSARGRRGPSGPPSGASWSSARSHSTGASGASVVNSPAPPRRSASTLRLVEGLRDRGRPWANICLACVRTDGSPVRDVGHGSPRLTPYGRPPAVRRHRFVEGRRKKCRGTTKREWWKGERVPTVGRVLGPFALGWGPSRPPLAGGVGRLGLRRVRSGLRLAHSRLGPPEPHS